MYCKNCGNELQAGEKFCSKCGTPIGEPAKKSKKKPSKIMLIMIAVGAVCALFGVGSLVMGNSDDSKGISRKSDVPLITQLENEYGIELSGIEAAGGSAVDNMILEDYLPRVDSRRFTTVINSEDNTENLIEEMTIDLPNDDGGYNYSVYNYLSGFTVQGVIFPDESDELYYMKQTNMLDDSVADMNFYIGLPGKTWTLEKKNEDTTIEMSIAPEFYTVTTPYGTYENCLLKYEHSSCETASWANSHTFTAYAPYGVGKIYSVTYSEDSPEAPLTYYTYIPEDSYSDLDSDSDSMTVELSPEIQNILDNSNHYTSESGLILAFSYGTELWVINPDSSMIIYHGNMGTQKYRDGWPVTGDSSIGCGDEILNFYDLEDGQRQATLTIGSDLYYFNENGTENDTSSDMDDSNVVPDDGMIIADIMNDESADLWINGNDTSALTLAMKTEGDYVHVYIFSVHAMEIIYSGVIDTAENNLHIMGNPGYDQAEIVYLNDNELEVIIDNDTYRFVRF